MDRRGKFITLEGIDGAGKSTHMEWIRDFLQQRGVPVVITREPGGTPLGEALREVILHQPMAAETEALLIFAARWEHLVQVIRPALAQGRWVVSDRFTDATFAYQGGGRGVADEKLAALETWVHPDLQPDLTLLFDVPEALAQQRRGEVRKKDRFEGEEAAFFARVRAKYQARARRYPDRIRVIDATRPVVGIQKELEVILASLFKD
ncbi:dTMP kinase [Pelomicrobium sp.]|jgi:dTMP kinase|uniref:dTMP kinase n=1 Tax=Pelomicrobium sp. TaxID=2815319 RepID=UPI002FDD9237